MKKIILLTLLIITMQLNAQKNQEAKEFVADLLSKMTLEEKIGQLNQYSGFFDVTGPAPTAGQNKLKYEHIKNGLVGSMLNVRGVEQVREFQELAVENSRLGIPMMFAYDVIHGHKTINPIPLAESASWNLELIKKSARIAAIEASAEGLNWTFAPMVDIGRDARWGRVMEGAGEDPYLGSKVAVARVQGFQGDDLNENNTIAACAKHFAAYGLAESGKEYNTVDVGTSTLYNVVFPPFKAAADAGVATFMNAFNELNGVPATGDEWLQREILKGEWGFEGVMVSDWGSIGELMDHGFAKDSLDAAFKAITAGSDVDMESYVYVNYLEQLVKEGKVSEDLIDNSVERILTLKYNLGLFEDPYKYCDLERQEKLIHHPDHHAFSKEIATESMVLLKNENDLLPLPQSGKKIGVIGQLAKSKNSPLGSWILAGEPNSAVSFWEGISTYDQNQYEYARGPELFRGEENFRLELEINETDKSGMQEAVDLAKDVDVVVMVLGEHAFQSGEARSRTEIGLPGLQQELLEAVYAVNKNIVLVLQNGRPLAIEWADENVPAILEAWHLGSESGHAIADVLFGKVNPSGKLPMTFPRSVGQVPIYYNYKNTGRPEKVPMVFWSHYIDEDNSPLYPFGYGLSYTTFDYSDFKVESGSKEITVSVEITNSGSLDGKEVVQLYIRDLYASNTRPVRELKGFEKITLKSGEKQKVTFTLTTDDLSFYNRRGEKVFEPGEFEIMIGDYSETVDFKPNK